MQKLMAMTLCWIGLCSLSSLLGGCISPEQQALVDADRQQRYIAGLASDCQSFGFTRGTPAFSQCMLQLDQAETQRRAALGAALIGSGVLLPQAPSTPITLPMPTPPPRPIQTNCFINGGWANCQTR